jgi:hypothetical protein
MFALNSCKLRLENEQKKSDFLLKTLILEQATEISLISKH